jgi:hypothetical protein
MYLFGPPQICRGFLIRNRFEHKLHIIPNTKSVRQKKEYGPKKTEDCATQGREVVEG